ncbi:MAG: AAA family ATPase [Alphaproteobacteria bacterium]|nr:AAA family ATPase [Alphaproteobacteria bacterium]
MAPRKSAKPAYSFPNPIDNDTLVGHTETLNNFMAAWNVRDTHPMHPVWMLCGPRGIGKATLAYKIAKIVYGNVGDFFIIDLAHNLDTNGNPYPTGKSISVKTVTSVIERMQMSSMSGGWRVVIIDAVDELTVSAANALLKMLEEPPANTLFLLIVHQLANVLPTIRSRARVEKMRPLKMNELRELCVQFMPDADISNDILRLANGSFGKIANLKASGGDVIYAKLIDALENPHSTASDLMNIAKQIAVEPAIFGILLDAIARFGLADIYPVATRNIADIERVHLEPEIGIFKVINDIKKCLQTPTAI